MNYGKAILVFILGVVLSFFGGAMLNDGGMAAAIAVCYIGALILGQRSGKN